MVSLSTSCCFSSVLYLKLEPIGIIDHDQQEATIAEIVDYLNKVYCNNVAVEFTHIKVSLATL